MKKILLIVLAILFTLELYAFEGFIPADEMKGEFIKLSSYFSKMHNEFDNGFSDFGLIFTYPELYSIFGLGTDIHNFGDAKYQRLEANLLFGIKPFDCFTATVSTGLITRSFKDLIFLEEEELPNNNGSAFTAGISGNLNIQDRYSIGVGLFNINQPDISFLDTAEKLPMSIYASADAVITNWMKAGVYLLRENDQNYFGANLSFSLPLSSMYMEFGGSSEKKISSYMVLNTLDYWKFKVGYEMYMGSDLKSSNYSMLVSKEFAGSMDEPTILIPSGEWDEEYREVPVREIPLKFSIGQQKRLKKVEVLVNNRKILEKKNIREYEKKDFYTDLLLTDGDNSIKIIATGVNGKYVEKDLNVYYELSSIDLEDVPVEVYPNEEIVISWESTLDNGKYGIYLYENNKEKCKINDDVIVQTSGKDGNVNRYKYEWYADEINNGKDFTYQIRVKEIQLGLSSETNEFHGDITEPSIRIINAEKQLSMVNIVGEVEDKSGIQMVTVNGSEIEIIQSGDNTWKFEYDGILAIGDNAFLVEAEDQCANNTSETVNVNRKFEYLNVDRYIPSQSKKNHNRIGIIIGVEDYENIESAKYADNDAQTIYDYFTKRLGIPQSNIFYYSENSKNLPQTIPMKSLFTDDLPAKINDLKRDYRNVEIVLYYSGHGLPDDEDRSNFYLLPKDYNQKYSQTMISFNKDMLYQMNKYIDDDDALIIILDACFSGKMRGSDELIAYGSKPASLYITIQQAFDNMVILSSSSGLQKSYSYDRASHGLFTYTLLRALYDFKSIKLSDLARYVKTTTETISSIESENILEVQQPEVIPPELLDRIHRKGIGDIKF